MKISKRIFIYGGGRTWRRSLINADGRRGRRGNDGVRTARGGSKRRFRTARGSMANRVRTARSRGG